MISQHNHLLTLAHSSLSKIVGHVVGLASGGDGRRRAEAVLGSDGSYGIDR